MERETAHERVCENTLCPVRLCAHSRSLFPPGSADNGNGDGHGPSHHDSHPAHPRHPCSPLSRRRLCYRYRNCCLASDHVWRQVSLDARWTSYNWRIPYREFCHLLGNPHFRSGKERGGGGAPQSSRWWRVRPKVVVWRTHRGVTLEIVLCISFHSYMRPRKILTQFIAE